MAIETFGNLKSSVADWLNRTDLTSTIPDFIHNAESSLRRDHRVRNYRKTTFSAAAEEEALPSDFLSMDVLAHDGGTHFGELETVGLGDLPLVKDRAGDAAGVPTHYALIGRSKVRFAPPPDQAYALLFGYWQTVPHLSDTAAQNWLLRDHPDLYLYATLVESAPYLRDDERLAMWKAEKERRIESLHQDLSKTQFSGPIVKQVRNPIP